MNLFRQRALMTCLFLPIYQVTITLSICTTLATAMGAQINRHLKVLGAGIFSTLADAKVRCSLFFFFFFRRCLDVLTILLRLPSVGITITTQLFYSKHVTSLKALYLISFALGLLQVRTSITFSIGLCRWCNAGKALPEGETRGLDAVNFINLKRSLDYSPFSFRTQSEPLGSLP